MRDALDAGVGHHLAHHLFSPPMFGPRTAWPYRGASHEPMAWPYGRRHETRPPLVRGVPHHALERRTQQEGVQGEKALSLPWRGHRQFYRPSVARVENTLRTRLGEPDPLAMPWAPCVFIIVCPNPKEPRGLWEGVTDTCLGRGTYQTRTRTIPVGDTQSPRHRAYPLTGLYDGVSHASPHFATRRHTSGDPRRYITPFYSYAGLYKAVIGIYPLITKVHLLV